GPSYISKLTIDGSKSGRHFTFQDFMGIGLFTGKKRHINAEVNINHYSNGNIFTENAGVKIPLTFTLGYAF
ncbi:MAG TPA: acyloxyacyl hydrolase, partial [Flavisolibacter sp.]|nr:acyloxyacyl hydrolase [Flavisolibacter sp.]